MDKIVKVQPVHSVISLADLGYLAKLSDKLDPDTMKIVSVKYRSPRIGNLEEAEMLTKAAESLQRIHVITGWDLPADAQYVKVLVEEFLEKLKDDFANMNFDEVLYAFRKYGIGVKDWGKKMNLDLICGVLSEYLSERSRASMQEEKACSVVQQRTYTPEELDNIQRADIEAMYQRLRNGIHPITDLPDYYRTRLIADGYITKESNDVAAFFEWCIAEGKEFIYQKL